MTQGDIVSIKHKACVLKLTMNLIDKLLQAPANSWSRAVLATDSTHHHPNLAICFSAPCGQIWACEDTFW